MRKNFVLFGVIFIGFMVIFAAGKGKEERIQDINVPDLSVKPQDIHIPSRGAVKPDLKFGKFPLYFIFNKGQVNEKVMFYAKASRYTLWLTKKGLIFDSIRGQGSGISGQDEKAIPPHSPHSPKIGATKTPGHQENTKEKEGIHHSSFITHHLSSHSPSHLTRHPSPVTRYERDVSRLSFIGANKNPEIVPVEEAQLRVNYFIGNDKSKWNCDVPTSMAVIYKSLYKDIDLKVYGIEKQIEYDWIVKPGGNPEDIRVQYKNVKGTRSDDEGNLLIETEFGELIHKKPVCYQKINSAQNQRRGLIHQTRVDVDGLFKKLGKNTYGFEVGEYDKNKELIIDPVVLAYSTYLGGGSSECGYGIAVDNSGKAYVTGGTWSTDFPTLKQYQTELRDNNMDVFVTKIDTIQTGASSLIYSTYLGGGSTESGSGIAVDSSGNAYVTGVTCSNDFPILNQYQTNQDGCDAFVTKIDTTKTGASSLIYSTYLGGGIYWEQGNGIAVDSSGNVYVTGMTYNTNFPTLNQYQTNQGSKDAFVTKIDTTKTGASSLIYSTYLGGGSGDAGHGIAIDNNGNAYVTGNTDSTDFPTRNRYQRDQGKRDAFVTKIDTTQIGVSSLIYSTYLGGGRTDYGLGIVVDSSGNAYMTGYTNSTDFPCLNQYQTYKGDWDAFVTKIDTTQSGASGLIYSTYLGGGGVEVGRGIAVDNSGYTYVTGGTSSTDFPMLNQYQTYQWSKDAFVTKLDTTQSGAASLIYSTYLGGGSTESGYGIAVDRSGNAYVTGDTLSTDFPILNQYQTDQPDRDAFVTKLIFSKGVPTVTTTGVSSVTATSASSGGNVISDEGAIVTARGICWSTSSNPSVSGSHTTDGSGLGSFTSSITGLTPNTTYYVRAYATNSFGTAYGNEVTFTTENGSTEPPKIKLNRTHLTFGAVTGGATTGSQTFLVSNSGGGSLNWNASVSDTWLEVSPFSGTADMIVTVSVDVTDLVSGSYTGNITMTDPNADNSPVSLYIYLEVKEKTQEMPPFGCFDTPLDGSGVSGSIPVTGWALDDVEVSTVKIFRSPVQGHETGLVYIGDAVLVEGARPDVEGKFPGYPKNYKAGWGYMMLTNFLPNGGNGTFTITAIVTDSSENEVTLGSKTIICDNASAVKPFGAIDTPTQGGEASGTDFVNFGWALTPLPNTIPTDGSTIKIWVDGVPLPGNPVYNNYRGDIANAFPNYNNSHGAVGYYFLDTTLYANGVHTIAWSVKDNVGNADGIGSRYFTIRNSHRAWSMEHGVGLASHGAVPNVSNIPIDYSIPVRVKKGFNRNVKPFERYPDENGIITVKIAELERIEVRLFPGGAAGLGPMYTGYGYQVTGNQLTSLPIGSSLDAKKGIFYWQPGPGFIGEYNFIFIKKGQDGEYKKKKIKIDINPKF